MDVFLMAGVHQQPDQSNYLAEFFKLLNFWWLVFTSNLISQTTWLKVKLKLVNLLQAQLASAKLPSEEMSHSADTAM